MAQQRKRKALEPDAEYRFRAMYLQDFIAAVASLLLAKEQGDSAIQECLLRDVVISYGRPFSGNRGFGADRHRLASSRVPERFLELHVELMALRNQLIAHSDLTRAKPRVRQIIGSVKWVTSAKPNYSRFFDMRGDIEQLLSEMAAAMQADLHAMAGSVRHDA